MNYSHIIKSNIELKRSKNILWENEFGSILRKTPFKEYYKDVNDYKIYYKHINNVCYFKIVPSYFELSCGLRYCEYYDGYINKNNVVFELIPILTQNVKRIKYSE